MSPKEILGAIACWVNISADGVLNIYLFFSRNNFVDRMSNPIS